MYYIIEINYVGPNQGQHVDADTIEIRTEAAIANGSHDACIDGWCGTMDGWAMYAHGEYKSIEEAREAVAEKFGQFREVEIDNYDPRIVETYTMSSQSDEGYLVCA